MIRQKILSLKRTNKSLLGGCQKKLYNLFLCCSSSSFSLSSLPMTDGVSLLIQSLPAAAVLMFACLSFFNKTTTFTYHNMLINNNNRENDDFNFIIFLLLFLLERGWIRGRNDDDVDNVYNNNNK